MCMTNIIVYRGHDSLTKGIAHNVVDAIPGSMVRGGESGRAHEILLIKRVHVVIVHENVSNE